MGASSRNNENVEPIIYLLCIMIGFFVVVLMACEAFWKDDAQIFQVIATGLSGFIGALLARIKPAQQQPVTEPEPDPVPQVKVV